MSIIGKVTEAMIQYYAGDAKRINHFLKVFGFAKAIGEIEGLEDDEQEILEIASLTHDIGIKNSELKYNSSAGNYQQIEGPPEAEKLLSELNVDSAIIQRVCWLIAHHHTYTDIQGNDYQILVEADFLVNAFEDEMTESTIKNISEKIFKTNTGKLFLENLYRKGLSNE